MSPKLTWVLLLVIGVAWAGANPARAQTFTSIAEGIVTDARGAVIPLAAVHAKGETVDRGVYTDSQGFYRIVELPPGAFTITVTHAGFATKKLEGIVLVVDRIVKLDIRLEIASLSESVTVTAATPL